MPWPCATRSEQFGIDCRMQTAIAMQQLAEPFIPEARQYGTSRRDEW